MIERKINLPSFFVYAAVAVLSLNLISSGQTGGKLQNKSNNFKGANSFKIGEPLKNNFADNLQKRVKKCSENVVALASLIEYGAIYAANAGKVKLPSDCLFRNQAEVQAFQNSVGAVDETINGIRVELQPSAMNAFLAARTEAERRGFEISPRGADASRRSYRGTVELWQSRFNPALKHWTKKGVITAREADRLRSLPLAEQVSEVIKFEGKNIYFGTNFNKSILQSVAPPGTSQHLSMLALDVEQHDDPKVRAVLARHGWFQTVRNDTPHFTYLGVAESDLPSRGLQKISGGGRVFWVLKAVSNINISTAVADSAKEDSFNESFPKEPPFSSLVKKTGSAVLKTPRGNLVHKALDGKYYTVSKDILMTKDALSLLENIAERYFALTGKKLHITSGYRSAERQAKAIYDILRQRSGSYIFSLYANDRAIGQIVNAYTQNIFSTESAVSAMIRVISQQIKNGVYISDHLLERAFDVRLNADFSALREAVRQSGGRVVREFNHYHLEF